MFLDVISTIVSYPVTRPYETAFTVALALVVAGLVYFFFKFNRDIFRTVDIVWIFNVSFVIFLVAVAVLTRSVALSTALAVVFLASVVAEVLYFRTRGGGGIIARKGAKVAALPFVTPDTTDDGWTLGAGLAEVVSRCLSAYDIGVLDPTRAALGYVRRGITNDAAALEWGEALEVNYLIWGKVRRVGGNVQIRYKIIDVFEGREWNRPRILVSGADPFEGAARVTADLTQIFKLEVKNEAALAYYRRPTVSAAAWRDYCVARRTQFGGSPEELAAATEGFKKALAADEEFTLAAVAAVEATLQLARRTVRDEEKFLALLDDAYRLALRTVRQRPELYETQNVMGEVFVFLSGGRDADLFRRAQTRFLEAVRLNPNSARSWYNLALISKYSVPDEDVGYADFLTKALAADPSFVAAHLALGRYFAERNDAEAARRQYRLALAYNPKNVGALNELGYFYLKRNDGEHAAEILEKSKEVDASNPTTRYYLGLAYLQQGNYPRAEEELWAAVAFKPEDVNYLRDLARVLEVQGKDAEALSAWEEVLKRISAADEAQRIRAHMARLAEKLKQSTS